MRNWWSSILAPRLPVRRNPVSLRVRPQLQTLETRYAPALVVGPNINVSQSSGSDAENAIIINPTNTQNLFASSTGTGIFRYSMDAGLTWQNSDISSIGNGTSGGDGQMAWDTFGNLFVTYFGDANLRTFVGLSTDGGATLKLSLDTGGFNDQPEIAVGAGSVWLAYPGGGNRIARGAAVTGLGLVGPWSAAQTASGTSSFFGDIAVGPQGQVMVIGQEGSGQAKSRIFASVDLDGLGPNGFGPQILVRTVNVGTFDIIPAQPNRTVDSEANLAWDRSGGANNGRVYMSFTDELVDESSDTEIFVIFSDDNGQTWSNPVRVHDDPIGNGLSQFLPDIAVDQTTGNVAVAWYDTRNDAGNKLVEVFGTISTDGGLTFEPNVKISQGQSITPGGFDFGDYNHIDFHAGAFYHAWGDNSNSTGDNPAGQGGALDLYTAMVQVVIGSGDFSADPNPINETESTTLRGTFNNPLGNNKGHIVTIDWGDGSKQTVNLAANVNTIAVPHQYLDDQQNQAIPIGVVITAAGGFKLTGSASITVFNLDPTEATITGVPAGVVSEGKKVTLGSHVVDPSPLDTFTNTWTLRKNGVVIDTNTGGGFSFTPDDQGTYQVSLEVTDDDGGFIAATPVTIFAKNVAPTADGMTNNGAKKTGEVVTISFINPTDAEADVAAGLRYDYDIDGNGTYGGGPDILNTLSSSVGVTYALEGTYSVKGRVKDKDGGISPDYFTDVVINNISGGNGGVVTTRYVVAGSDVSPAGVVVAPSVVKVFDLAGVEKFSLQPFGKAYTRGYRVASGDVNGDKTEDIIVAGGPGANGQVRVINGVDGTDLFTIAAYPAGFSRGVFLATADLNRDGFADIIVSAGPGEAQPVMAFSGKTQAKLFSISPFGATWKGGVSVAAGDVTGDKVPDLIAGQLTLGTQVKVFRYTGTALVTAPVRTFTAMPLQYKGGVFVAAGDVDGDKRADIIVGSNTSFGLDSRVRVFSGLNFAMLRDFVPFPGYRMGVRVSTEDLDGDGKADLLIAPATYSMTLGQNPRVLGLKGTNLVGKLIIELPDFAFQGGVFVG